MIKDWKWFKLMGVGLWIFIITQLDLKKVVKVIKSLDLVWFIVAIVCLFLTFLFKGLRWRIALQAQGISYSLNKIIGIILVSSFIGFVTPGRLGDLVKVGYLKHSDIPITLGLANVILDRVYDILLLLLFGCLGFVFFMEFFSAHLNSIASLLGFVGIVILGLFIFYEKISITFQKILKLVLPSKVNALMASKWNEFWNEFKRLAFFTFPFMLIFSFLIYASYFTEIYALSRSLGLSISFLYLGMCFSAAALVSFLPISIGGLGTREAVLIMLFAKISLSPESAVLLSFIDVVIFALLLGGIVALALWIGSGKKILSSNNLLEPK